jgi:radical SAM/Cys-rich protein
MRPSKPLDPDAEQILPDLGVSLRSEAAGAKPARSLASRGTPLEPAAAQRETLKTLELHLGDATRAEFERSLQTNGVEQLSATRLDVFQVNVGKLCNMTCKHCHVDAGPDRTDAMMDDATVAAVMQAIERSGAKTVDITGGAPELHPRFRDLVDHAVGLDMHVIDRCNLTILLVPKFTDLPQWLADRGVEIVASLPHYRRLNTDAQRGGGTFERSIEALRRLNEAGYGQGDPARTLTLMSNPAGAYLSGCQHTMEREWKEGLQRNHGVSFDRLFVLNNMPIARYLEWLLDSGNLQQYMQTLVDAFNPAAVDGLMCRNTISVAWNGLLYDCDFNQMLELPIESESGRPLHVSEFAPEDYTGRRIVTGRHCYGCTAGAGSSCAGATT